jgi:hypothetical protein
MTKQARVRHPLYNFLPTEIEGVRFAGGTRLVYALIAESRHQ